MRLSGWAALRGYTFVVYGFVYLPIMLMGLFSLNSSDMIAFPLTGFTLDWYNQILHDGRIFKGLVTTMAVAFPVTIITTVLGSMAALVLTRHKFKGKTAFLALLVLPFFVPKLIFAIAQVTFLNDVGIPKGLYTVWISQAMIILPFVTVIIASVLFRVDKRLEEAAGDLGATPWQTFRRVTLPLMKNGILAGSFISFVLSNAEYTVSYFTSGRAQPLSVLVASDFRFHLSPSLNALAMLIVFFNILVIVISEWFRRRSVQA
ncbi:binding-protein-dependent transport systems inner membrane component [Pseudodesulfovibrio mercurii]|uniref:Binding-protein-dependent transport systems inner membrane component n=1 Tax=Pseudodesulfovibrio mercurii TaxID=641491 RepID=F0JD61_9BACT|nr:ABC transporter permease [Pseudodesulfovibrio mercurii]EGB14553.1 binding-protein-dependent transport systems inner membrane component [Pseudodesulfovibrio mercurii]